MTNKNKIAILGGGNLGVSLARGLVNSGKFNPENITITKRNLSKIKLEPSDGYKLSNDNKKAVSENDIIIVAVLPQQFNGLMDQIKDFLNTENHVIISLVTGVKISDIQKRAEKQINVLRAMPNTAIAIGESMTCICCNTQSEKYISLAHELFDTVGETIQINEEHMASATALCACGIAFFLRAVRAASQGGIEIGFHSAEALKMAAQTAKGAAGLLLHSGKHPESEIDKVTSPEGCTIAGLNEMEHQGFSSALIKGITTSASKAAKLYSED